MSLAVLTLQGLLSCVALVAVAQRCRLLLFTAPVSAALFEALSRALTAGNLAAARALARESARRWPSRVVLAALGAGGEDGPDAVDTELSDLASKAEAQLGLIRVSATLGSTLGLLGAILAIQRGFSGHGLLALRAGLAQQVALSEAVVHMAIGIGTAAFCFAAWGLLSRAARDGRRQTSQMAARCRLSGEPERE